MKKVIILAALLLLPLSAQADFSLKSSEVVKTVSIPRQKMRPSLEIINERYVPGDVKQKYNMTDDYVEMTDVKPNDPIIVEPPPVAVSQKKKRLEIIGGPPPILTPVVPSEKAPEVISAKPEATPKPVPVPTERVETWRARKGEGLKDVLKRWSERSGVDFTWTAAESPKITKEFSHVGTFETAVNQLMKQDSGPLKMKFSEGDGSAPLPVSTPMPLTKKEAEAPQFSAVSGKTWFASSGATLQGVLHAWTESEGASLVWQADQAFAVTDSINEKGSFEAAVETLLSKYETKAVRPVGQLYRNPVSGEKVLVIKTDPVK